MATHPDPPGFAEWELQVPASFKQDPIWRTPAYRFGLMLADLAAADADVMRRDPARRAMADQLLRAVQAISANLAEGYGHTTGPERARYYEYALTSAREARDWYFKARSALEPRVVEARQDVLLRIIKILTVVIPRERATAAGRARRVTPRGR